MDSSTCTEAQAALRQALAAAPGDGNRLVLAYNKGVIAQALALAGVVQAIVTYAGAGDEGQIEEVTLDPETPAARAASIEVAELAYRWDPETSRGGGQLAFVKVDLENALETLCDSAVEITGHNGYQNGDGGEATFTLVAATAQAHLEHNDHYVESDLSVHAL
jgi:hypothetical protein